MTIRENKSTRKILILVSTKISIGLVKVQDAGITEKMSEGTATFQQKQQDKNIETEGTTYEKGSF